MGAGAGGPLAPADPEVGVGGLLAPADPEVGVGGLLAPADPAVAVRAKREAIAQITRSCGP